LGGRETQQLDVVGPQCIKYRYSLTIHTFALTSGHSVQTVSVIIDAKSRSQ